MKALSVRQPWASHIVYSGKDVENRGWTTICRGSLVIHAGQRIDEAAPTFDGPMPLGALIGVVELVNVVHNYPSHWAVSGQRHWVLAKPIALRRPIEYRGRQGLFEVDPSTSLEIASADEGRSPLSLCCRACHPPAIPT